MSREIAVDLLARARDDAAAVEAMVSIAGVTDAIVGFHAQQAVEKSIKAVLAANDQTFRFTHDLEGLMERCQEDGIELPPNCNAAQGHSRPMPSVIATAASRPPRRPQHSTLLATTAVAWATDLLRK